MQQIPEDVVKKLFDFDQALTSFEDSLDDHFNLQQNEKICNLDKAKSELATLFAVNSLYWAYLHCKGKDPSQDAELAVELVFLN
uniref:Nuclear nucleic acid-binding protein C1D n=1 Tax=Meloidogyne hapla TaxID=6305 RepID=A0A1I8B6T8_MELHA